MSTISLVMIVKDEEEILERSVDSVKDVVDEFIIVDTGSTDSTKDIIRKYGELHEIPFTNFVDTKNAALELATCDYILFMDADERLVAGLDNLKEHAESGVDCLTGNIIEGPAHDERIFTNTYLRARMWANNGEWKFDGPGVHEVIMGPGEITVDYEIRVRHEHIKKNKASTSRERFEKYVDILEKAIEENPKDTRAWFYLGRTHKDLGNFTVAIDVYEKYLSLSNLNFLDEEWQAIYDIAECWKKNGEYDKAMEACDRAIKIDPRRAEAYNFKGIMYYNMQDWEKARECFEESIPLPLPDDVSLFIDPTAYGMTPYDYVSICYDRAKKYREAGKAIEQAISLGDSYDDRIIKNLAWVNTRTHLNIFMTLGKTPEDVYGGILNDRGVHGVETTYIELSQELANLGHTVFLFCTCTEEHIYNGVYYIPYTHIDSYSTIVPDVIITSRWFDVLYREDISKKIIWLQDALFKDPDRPDAFDRADAVVCSSRWHRQYIAERFVHSIGGKKLNIIPLGIRKDLFSQAIVRNPFKVIYSSNPDRGLYTLIDMWEELTTKIPLIELVICYGWEGLQTWSDTDSWKEGVDRQKQEALSKLSNFDNVKFKGRLTKKELVAEMLSASVCLYPNNFWETFCLTALETQAAGVTMITTDMGALSTTLSRECNVLIRLDPHSAEYKKEFIQATLDLFNDSERCELWSSRCRDFVFSRETGWEDISKIWERLFWDIL